MRGVYIGEKGPHTIQVLFLHTKEEMLICFSDLIRAVELRGNQ
jgi:hypothetical protein